MLLFDNFAYLLRGCRRQQTAAIPRAGRWDEEAAAAWWRDQADIPIDGAAGLLPAARPEESAPDPR
jgi:hypothetical protein